MLTDESKEGRPESVVVPQRMDAVRELIMQDLHVTYLEMKASLGIKVFKEIKKNNRQHRTIFHHDNADCHTSAETSRLLEGPEIELTGHPPYNPDLAPNGFYLFPCEE
ncbi:Mariner Mos1 transposase [Eumeta japonica]|uniref:Mariner Mos1 transposase n=1 Tax=Eumeta variegata TaxID=151549 RepID=A0A4C1Z7K7_EUMVA|nr:Mariner Mos1 transposase [Eumeta japonica]